VPSSGECAFIWSNVADARNLLKEAPLLETRASRVLGAEGVLSSDAPGRAPRGPKVPAYSSSELISGEPSDARALANISACSHCLRVRLFR
jgi:hypothetical protein